MGWREEMEIELARAREARARGGEGRARVCARRAAGIAVREWLRRQGRAAANESAYDLLRGLLEAEDLPGRARSAAEALTLRVDETFRLPAEIDLIAAAESLREELLPERNRS